MELCDAIRDQIPVLVQMLKDEESDVRSAAASSLGNMAKQGGFQQDVIRLWLISIHRGAS